MSKKHIRTAVAVLLLFALMTVLCSCGSKKDAEEPAGPVTDDVIADTEESITDNAAADTEEPVEPPEADAETVPDLTDEQALSAVKNYCYEKNPDLEEIVKAGEYPVYWDVSSSDEQEIVILFRSYTGAQNRYYIDRSSGDTYVTEFVPGITDEEQKTDESFNIRDHLSEK